MYSNRCGYNLYYEISGNVEGEWLLLFHGLAAFNVGNTKLMNLINISEY